MTFAQSEFVVQSAHGFNRVWLTDRERDVEFRGPLGDHEYVYSIAPHGVENSCGDPWRALHPGPDRCNDACISVVSDAPFDAAFGELCAQGMEGGIQLLSVDGEADVCL